MSNTKKITNLTNKWYSYVNLDHHKSRDCHWMIDISYSYGEPPKYYAYHNGYVISSWRSPDCDTLEDAEAWLINKLERELEKAKLHLEEIISLGDSEEARWIDPDKKAPGILKELLK